MRSALAFCLLLLALPASAQTLLSGFASKHASGDWCENNIGVGYRQDTGPWAGWGAGVYKNSLCKASFYVAREWLWPVAGPLHAGVLGVAATGYNYPVIAVPLPELVWVVKPVELAVVVQPFNLSFSPAFVAIQFRYQLK